MFVTHAWAYLGRAIMATSAAAAEPVEAVIPSGGAAAAPEASRPVRRVSGG